MNKRTKSGLTDHELAGLAGVAESTLKLHRKAGAPMPRSRRDIEAWLPRYHEWRAIRAKRPGPAAAPPNPETTRWVSERMKWLAVGARLRAGREAGELVPRSEVVEFASEAVLTCRQRMNDMATKLPMRLLHLPDEAAIQVVLQEEVDAICADFERGMTRTIQAEVAAERAASSSTVKEHAQDDTDGVASEGAALAADAENETEEPADDAGDTDPPATAGNP